MNPRVSYILVGLFVVLMGGAAMVAAIWLSSATEARTYTTYVTYISESVSGLNADGEVTYRGVEVGQVREISLDRNQPDRVRVLLDIQSHVPIKTDTVATLVSQGITGIAHIELSGGTSDAQPAKALRGQLYAEIQSGPSLLVRLDTTITNLVTELTTTATHLSALAQRLEALFSDQNQLAISQTLQNVSEMTAALNERLGGVGDVLADVTTILDNAATASHDIPLLISSASGVLDAAARAIESFRELTDGVDETASAITDTANEVTETVDEIGDTVALAQADLETFSRNTPDRLESLIVELQGLTEAMRSIAVDLERNPDMFIFGRPETPLGPGE